MKSEFSLFRTSPSTDKAPKHNAKHQKSLHDSNPICADAHHVPAGSPPAALLNSLFVSSEEEEEKTGRRSQYVVRRVQGPSLPGVHKKINSSL